MLIISPFAKKAYISHTQYELSSVLKFAEEAFGLPSLGQRDATANDTTDSFDFTQTARSPLLPDAASLPAPLYRRRLLWVGSGRRHQCRPQSHH